MKPAIDECVWLKITSNPVVECSIFGDFHLVGFETCCREGCFAKNFIEFYCRVQHFLFLTLVDSRFEIQNWKPSMILGGFLNEQRRSKAVSDW